MPDPEHAESRHSPVTRDKSETHDDKGQPEANDVTPAGTGFPIVGLGASAGGLEAFSSFFDNMPPDSGMAFVLVMHLAPDRESRGAELLAGHTEMAIHPARDGMRVEPNTVYVIQPDNVLTIREGVLHVTAPAPRASIATSSTSFSPRWPRRRVAMRSASCCPAPARTARGGCARSRNWAASP